MPASAQDPSATQGGPRPSLVVLREGGSRPPLFFVHGGAGHVFQFRLLGRLLNEDQPAYGFEARGLWADQPPLTTVPELAARYIEEMRAVQPRGPHAILGFSLGGYITWEMARELRRQGETPLLALLDTPTPAALRRLPRTSVLDRMRHAAAVALFHLRIVYPLPMARRRAYLGQLTRVTLSRGRRRAGLGGADYAPNIPLARRAFAARRPVPPGQEAVWAATARAFSAYEVEPYDGAVTLFRAAIQEPWRHSDRTLGWAPLSRGMLQVVRVPGFHSLIFVEPHVRALAAAVTDWAASAARPPPRARRGCARNGSV